MVALKREEVFPSVVLKEGQKSSEQRGEWLQELVFLEERCEDEKTLKDYGINKDFIVQVKHDCVVS